MAPPRKTSQADSPEPPNRWGPFLVLPSLTWPFRRRTSSGSIASTVSTVSSTGTTSETSPTSPTAVADIETIHRARPDCLRCRYCATEFAYASQIISKGFTGRQGRAYLVAPPQQEPQSSSKSGSVKKTNNLLNIKVGKVEGRALVTGWHEVADITCRTCGETVGWKYVDAKDEQQKYKVGKFILETTQTVRHASWEDKDVFVIERDYGAPLSTRRPEGDNEAEAESGPSTSAAPAASTSSTTRKRDDSWTQKLGDTGTGFSTVEFDSEDSEECDELFAGTWDPEVAARRRARRNRRRGISSPSS